MAKYPVDAENEDPAFPEHHQLILKTAALGADAIDKERNVIEVKFVNASGGEQTLTLASLTTGRNIDLLHQVLVTHLCHLVHVTHPEPVLP